MIPNFPEEVERVFHDWKYDHPKVLYGLIRWLRPKTVVEVGTYRGYGASWMARALQENGEGRLYCIDAFCCPPHQYGDMQTHWETNLKKLGVFEQVTLIRGRSHQVEWPKSIDMAFIDADHSYAACCHDVNQAIMLGAKILAVDNTYSAEGCQRWAEEFRQHSKELGIWEFLEVPHQEGFLIAVRGSQIRTPFTYTEEHHPFGDLSNPTTEYGKWCESFKKQPDAKDCNWVERFK